MPLGAILVVGYLAFGVQAAQGVIQPGAQLTSANDFNIHGTVTNLTPGVPATLTLTASNPNLIPITVSSVSVAAAGAPPSSCPLSNLTISGTTLADGPVTVGGLSQVVAPSASADIPVPIVVGVGAANGCQDVTFNFTYSGTATYTEPTRTSLATSANPSTYGQAITLTAKVAPGEVPESAAVTPVGTVTFYRCTAPLTLLPGSLASTCTTRVALGPAVTLSGDGQALLTVSSLTAGTAPLFAEFTATVSTSFAPSASTVLNQVVNRAPTTLSLSGAPNPSLFGQAVTFTARTTPGAGPTGTVTFRRCTTPACTATTPLGTGALDATGRATLTTARLAPGTNVVQAVYGGDTNYLGATSAATNQVVNFTSACVTNTVNGGLTVRSGQAICVGRSGVVNGGITVQAGGALALDGPRINGGIAASGASAVRLCGATVSGNVTVSASTGFVLIGDVGDNGGPACAANTLTSPSVSLTGNLGGFDLGGNRIGGSVAVSANTGPATPAPEIGGNTISGSLACAATNNPAVTNGGQRNTVSGAKTGQCAGAGF